MILTIDIGNSRIKAALFEHNTLLEKYVCNKNEILEIIFKIQKKYTNISNIVVSSVGNLAELQLLRKHFDQQISIIDANTKLPFENLYATPQTLGIDRMVLTAGAVLQFPEQNRLIIDAGTCVTYDFVNQKNQYLGGGISPGLNLRYQSLNQYTAKLPLLTLDFPNNLIGNSTQNAIHSGVVNGLVFEIEGFISAYLEQYRNFIIILTGGDADFLAKRLKNTIFANSNFLLESLHLLHIYNSNND